MRTWYIKFEQVHSDPVWGMEGTRIRSPLIRCTRNTLRKAVFEWVGCAREVTADEMTYYRKAYPLVHRELK